MTGPARRAWSAGLAIAAACSGVTAFWRMQGRGPDASTWDVTLAWSIGVGCLLGLAVLGRRPPGDGPPARAVPGARTEGPVRPDGGPSTSSSADRRGAGWRRRLTPFDVAGLWILGLAAAARLVALHRFPTVIDGDEGTFLLQAQRARGGALANPWGTGALTSVDAYYAWEGRIAAVLGPGIGAYRVLSAVLGVVTVLAVWRLGRRVIGEIGGLIAMGIIALLPLHLWASRVALDNVTHAAVIAVVLVFLDRAVLDGRRSDALAAGVVVGLGFYGYVGGGVFLAVALAVLVVVAALPAFATGWRRSASIGGWMVLASVVVAGPLLGHYADHPDRFGGRMRQVDGVAPSVGDRLVDLVHGALYPVLDRHGGREDFYRVDGPFLGVVLGPLAVAGTLVWAWWAVRRWRSARRGSPEPSIRCEPLLVAWSVLTAAVAQTETMASQRWLALTPLWAVAAASALVALGRVLVARTALRPAPLVVGAAVLVGAVGLAGIARFYDEDQQLRAYGDRRTTGAYDLGWRLARGTPGLRLRSLGAPFQPFSGFGNLVFQAPGGRGSVIEVEPLAADGTPGVDAPVLADREVAAVAAERIPTDRCPLAAANPGATFAEVRDRYGVILYLLAAPGPIPLPTGPTPAGTTLAVVDVAC